MPTPTSITQTAAAIAFLSGACHALIVHDDFLGPTINPALWTTAYPNGASSHSFDSGRLRFQSRAYLNSLADFDPFTDPVSVTGRWEFGNESDFLQIATRSEGAPQGTYGENNNAVELWVRPPTSEIVIQQWVSGSPTTLATVPVSIQPGDIFDFEVIDNGANFSFSLTEVGGENVTVSGDANTTLNTGFSKVTVHNRETSVMYGFLHEITIETIPAPSPIAAVFVLAAAANRRRR